MAVAQTKQSAHSAQGLLPSGDLAVNQTSVPEFSKDQELLALRQMLLIRRFEEKAGQMYGMGLIGGFCHLYIGQEAIVVGMKLAMRDGDQMITGYRDHGHMLASGMDPKGVIAELTGLGVRNKCRGRNDVSLTYLGDGSSNQGQVYESLGMAELWKLPVIYVIENNRYAMGMSVARSSSQPDLSKRGAS